MCKMPLLLSRIEGVKQNLEFSRSGVVLVLSLLCYCKLQTLRAGCFTQLSKI